MGVPDGTRYHAALGKVHTIGRSSSAAAGRNIRYGGSQVLDGGKIVQSWDMSEWFDRKAVVLRYQRHSELSVVVNNVMLYANHSERHLSENGRKGSETK
jgi:hypothetical protein